MKNSLLLSNRKDKLDKKDPLSTFVETTTTEASNVNSWLIAFVNTANTYTIHQRGIKYYFGSEKQTRFFYDPQVKIYDPLSGKLLKDRIDVLKVNNRPIQKPVLALNYDVPVSIAGTVIEGDGFVDDTKIEISFADKDSDGSPDLPNFWDYVVGTVASAGQETSYVFFVNDQDVSCSQMKVLAPGVVKIVQNETEIDGNIYSYNNNDVVFMHQLMEQQPTRPRYINRLVRKAFCQYCLS